MPMAPALSMRGGWHRRKAPRDKGDDPSGVPAIPQREWPEPRVRPSLNREASRLGDVALGVREYSSPIVAAYENRLKLPNIRPISFVALRNSSPQAGDLWDPMGTPEAPRVPGRRAVKGGPMKKRLTDRFVQSVAPPPSERAVYIDTETPGLELRVSPDGGKSWSIRYRPKGGERTRQTYGTYPVRSLADARRRAFAIAAAAADGVDLPGVEKREREEQRKAADRPQTVGDLL